jgi:hypothetical protein
MLVTIGSSTKCCNGRFLIGNCLLKPHKTRVGNTSIIKDVSQHLAVITGVLIPLGFGNIVVGNCFFILAKMVIANTGMHVIASYAITLNSRWLFVFMSCLIQNRCRKII